AKTTMADGNAPLVAQGGGHEAGMQTLAAEARQPESPARIARLDAAQHAHAGNATQTREQPPADRQLVVEHRVEAELEHRFDGDAERDRADDVGRPGLLAVGEIWPNGVVPRDDVDSTAAHDLRRAREEIARRDQHAGAVRRVHLVSRQRYEVEVARVAGGADLDAMVRCELRRIDRHASAEAV